MNELLCTLRSRRAAAGLTQRELAQRVGVSRQALVAIEAGRQVPSTALSLQIASVLGCRVEDLFTLQSDVVHAAWDASDARRVAMGRVDGRWVAHPLADASRPADGTVVDADGDTAAVRPLVDPRVLEGRALVAGCAPLLGVLAGRADGTWIPASSGRALSLLEHGLVHVAGLHLVDTSAPGGHAPLVRARFPGRASEVIHLTRWTQGIVVAPGNPLGIRDVGDLLRDDVRVATRQPESGASKLLERLLGTVPEGAMASGHAEVARLVRWGVVDAGIAIEGAALAEGLGFVPLAEERFDLVVPRARLDQPAVAGLLERVGARAFRDEAAVMPGYDLSHAGEATTVR